MERLKEFLDWNLKNPHNVNFKMIVAKEDREETLKAMREMSDLLDTGLTLEKIIEMDKMYTELAKEVMQLREKGTAMLLENIKCAKKKEGYLSFGTCPKCKRRVSNVEGGNYCQNCGQRLKWEE